MPISIPDLRTSRLRRRVRHHHTRIHPMGWVLFLCVAVASLAPVGNAQRGVHAQEADKDATAQAKATPAVSYPTGTIYTVAGNGQYNYGGDGSKATVASMRQPTDVTWYKGNLYIADYGNDIIREVNTTTGDISTVAGTPVQAGYMGDGGPATSAKLRNPQDVKFDNSGNMYIADTGNNVVRVVDLSGNITTIAGTGTAGYNGDGGPAIDALLNSPIGLAFDPTYSNLYISDEGNNVIRIYNIASKSINTFAGTGVAFYSGDGGPAALADLNQPSHIFVDTTGNLYIPDTTNYVVRKVTASTGFISTIAGTGAYAYSYPGDGTVATLVPLRGPSGVVVDSMGNVFFSDFTMSVIFEVVASTNEIHLVAGKPFDGGFSGDGGQSTSALVYGPDGLGSDPEGDLYFADYQNQRVRETVGILSETVTANPTFSPTPGTYTSSQSVTLADTTPGAVIYYTTDGTAPTTSSSQYGGTISVTDTTTIMAMAVAPGYTQSPVVSGTYTINAVGPVATPTFSPAGGPYSSAQTVMIGDTTSGATIYYTTDGSTPSAGSTKYTGAITVSATETIKAIAIAAGDTNSAVASAAYTITLTTVATPMFSPAAGTYSSAQTVTIGDATSGASIYYTTDGSTPTASSTKYTSAITVSATETIKAIAVASGYANSSVATALYTIQQAAAAPVISVASGTYTTVQKVTIADATSGATIHYTTDGSTPTASSTEYTGTITVSSSETLKAIAIASGYSNSPITSVTYTINLAAAATPTFSPAAGTYTSAQTVTLSDTTTGASIYYTTDGSTPTSSSKLYSGAITVSTTETLKAIAIATGYSNSAVASATYTINLAAAVTPTFSPAAGTYTSVQTVAISDTTTGASIYYTTDGSTPTSGSTKYTAAISVSATETIKAIAMATGYSNSAVASATYTINLAVAATPTFSPAAGIYTSVQTVAISDTTTGASIYYTTDGSTPTSGSTKYTAAISVSATETIKAIAIATGYSNSAVASATYTINTTLPVAAAPTFSPAAGTYTSVQTVTLSDTTTGAAIYYTTDGSTPTASSTKYTAAISVRSTETIKAIAAATGYTDSGVVSAAYTINIALPVAATPTFSPAAGTYTSAQSVTLSDTTTGASIYYTTDGSTPTASSTKYTAAIAVGSTETIKAIAAAAGYTDSGVASAAYTISLPAATFTLAASPSTATVTSGQSAQFTLTVTPQNGFTQSVAFSCSGLPSGDACSFSPATVTPTGAPITTALTVGPGSSTAMNETQALPWWTKVSAGVSMALLLWPMRKRRRWAAFVLAVLFGAGFAMVGCGGSSSAKSQNYTVTVTATGGSVTQTTPLTLTVKN